ncbi:MAG: MarR family transcriptional regulator, partial [Candidatus Omnitrophica bacterium]|nr:MarR family transcriptional regulator [Candidatus Omnitrophota bacterium]
MPKLDINLGEEMAKMHPLLLRKMAIKQMKVLGGDNIGITGMAILDILKEKDPCRMGKIAKVMGFTMSAATGAIDKMVEKDLVK